MTRETLSALVVDDERAVRELTARMLGGQGFHCDLAADGNEAVAYLEANRYDVLVTDLCMPNCHGHELCVQALGRHDRPSIVVLTGVLEPRLAQDLYARGVDEICYKPVNYAAFARRVRELAQRRSGAASAGPMRTPAEAAQTRPAAPTHAEPDQAEHLIAVLLADSLRSTGLSRLLADGTTQPVAISSCDGLYDLIRQQRVDLVVIEQRLGGLFTGLEILERLSRDLLRPAAVLLTDSEPEVREQAALAGVEAVVTADGELAHVADAVRTVLSRLKADAGLVPRPVRTVVDRLPAVPFLPQLLVRLATYLEMPFDQIPLQDLVREISVDPRATSELLKLTNSASTGLPRRVTSVFEAVNLHGAPRTISLLFSLATLEMHADLLKHCPAPFRQWYYHRSVLIASTAATFAGRLEKVSAETAFILGLLQETGVLALASAFPHRYRAIVQRVQRVGQLQLHALEAADLRFTHADVSAAMLDRWGLPLTFIRPILDHHEPDRRRDRSVTEQSYMRVMRIGEAVADLADIPHPARRARLNALLSHYGSAQSAACRESLTTSLETATESCRLFSLPAPEESVLRQLLQQVVPAEC